MDKFEDFINSDDIIEYKSNNKEFDTLFSVDELQIIFNAIDKTDFSQMAVPRWLDLKPILDQIVKTKDVHANASLTKLTLSCIHETWPPQNKYYYYYNFCKQ
jgi:hypothetical protein